MPESDGSRIGTPSADSSEQTQRERRGRLLIIIISLLGGALLLLPALGSMPVFEVSEGREGVVVREILNGGSKILPLRNGTIVPSKPILFHWISAALASLAGTYQEFGLRLPSVLAALLTLVVVGLTAQRLLGSWRQGLLAVLLLGTNAGFFQMAQDGRVDMLFTLFVTAVICRFLLDHAATAQQGVRSLARLPRSTFIIGGLLLGGAILSKGPLGVVLPLLVIGLIALTDRRPLDLRYLLRWELLLALLVAAPWYLAAAFTGGEGFLGRQLFFENVSRFVGAEGITVKPPLYYLGVMWAEGAPWSYLFGLMTLLLAVPLWPALRLQVLGALRSDERRRYLFFSGLLWFVGGIVFFSLSVGKRRAYLLPLFPGLALCLTVFLSDIWSQLWNALRSVAQRYPRLPAGIVLFVWSIVVLAISLTVLLPYGAEFAQAREWHDTAVTLRSIRDGFALFGTSAKFLGALLIAAGAWCVYQGTARVEQGEDTERQLRYLAQSFLWLLFLVLGFFIPLGTTIKGVTHSYRPFAERVANEVSPSEKITFIKTLRDESFDCFFFYFGRHVTMVDPSALPQTPGLYLARRRWLDAQGEGWRERVSERFEGGRRIDLPEERLVLFALRTEREAADNSNAILPKNPSPKSPPAGIRREDERTSKHSQGARSSAPRSTAAKSSEKSSESLASTSKASRSSTAESRSSGAKSSAALESSKESSQVTSSSSSSAASTSLSPSSSSESSVSAAATSENAITPPASGTNSLSSTSSVISDSSSTSSISSAAPTTDALSSQQSVEPSPAPSSEGASSGENSAAQSDTPPLPIEPFIDPNVALEPVSI